MIHLVVNPIAGNGKAKETGALVDEYLTSKQIEHALFYTNAAGHATALARESAAAGVETVISIGGDGTLSETAMGLMYSRTALGVVPAGTGNDLVKTLRTPSDWKEAVDFILAHEARPLDTGMLNEMFFINECGAGFDVMVLDYAAKAKKYVQGIWPYLYGVICAIVKYKPIHFHIEIGEDIVLDDDFLVVAIANGRFIGGGIPIAPLADPSDGLFDIMILNSLPRWKLPFYLPSLLGGTLHKRKANHLYRAATCRVTSPGMRLNHDGDIDPIDSALFRCERNALSVHW